MEKKKIYQKPQMEVFKTHPTTGLVVSDKGRVITCGGKRITYGSTMGNGYKHIKFKKKHYLVHRLVAETFLENPHHLPCVNHKDENPSNNNIENLEWCTHQYNMTYGTARERAVANTDYKAIAAKIDYKAIAAKIDYKAIAEKLSKPVYQYTKEGVLVKEWASTHECHRNGFHSGNVSACCNGKLPHYKGFIWSYVEK